jgi:hypothetical protein
MSIFRLALSTTIKPKLKKKASQFSKLEKKNKKKYTTILK